MPNYDFKCDTCTTIVEIQDTAPPACPSCGINMTRIWSIPGIKFNAPGFYSTGG